MATRAEWSERVKRWKRSGLSGAEFAQREGLKAPQLYWWTWKLGASDPAPAAADEPRFLPVRVVGSPAAASPRPEAALVKPSSSWGSPVGLIEIVLPNGRLVRVPPGFDPATLERVLSIAAEAGAC